MKGNEGQQKGIGARREDRRIVLSGRNAETHREGGKRCIRRKSGIEKNSEGLGSKIRKVYGELQKC